MHKNLNFRYEYYREIGVIFENAFACQPVARLIGLAQTIWGIQSRF